ncbi:two component transcriptional regulator, winged helix family [Trichlorobacter thiogenes]|uniref:Phosphate regulon transcriptional regulatory protein PhoB n=1 Tax=Trichlorobacter thiogenes TaxID=115783 RepID=A0A1T4MFE9_9BACT|nr:response regulator transcription factor [Trichlorobacter thiogenes]SJZ65595.1 two component transcriptional regulator, winged helix family [Trichlorobacter thiogenes]
MKKVLIVEDERDLAELLAYNLEKEGYQALVTGTGLEGLETARRELPDLILLDLMLPGMMGTEVCSSLRHSDKTRGIPVLMLTARGDEIDRVVGFEMGADDYIVKPFSMRELMLRIRAILRRSGQEPVNTERQITMGTIAIDCGSHRVTVADAEIELTSTEYKLLLYLAEHSGRVMKRELLLQDVWGYNFVGDTRTVDTHVTRLRNKLGDAGEMIKTVRGFGYKLEE